MNNDNCGVVEAGVVCGRPSDAEFTTPIGVGFVCDFHFDADKPLRMKINGVLVRVGERKKKS
jgi:hypothetical protein